MNKIKNRLKGIFNKYVIMLLFTYFCFGVGFSYAYYAYEYENESVIVGNVIAIDADLDVQLVTGTNGKMVPLKDEALNNAINGNGGASACVDSNNNLSCQVYKITLTNNASRLQHIVGTVELYAKSGSNNVYNNLKWRELTNQTTVNEDTYINGLGESLLEFDFTLETRETRVWYIAVWISEMYFDQVDIDKGQFGGTVTFGDIPGNVFTETIMAPNADPDTDIDFTVTSDVSGTNGIYLRSGTENNLYPIYYYRGNVNNNLIFADMCWKVVRTTETGGLKLIYNGRPTDGECNDIEKVIVWGMYNRRGYTGPMSFNSYDVKARRMYNPINYNYSTYEGYSYAIPNDAEVKNMEYRDTISPAYVGYMYSNEYEMDVIEMDNTTTYLYANDVTYSNGVYTLVNTNAPAITSSNWTTLSADGLKNNHYTCFTTGTTCEEVYYIYNTDSINAYFLILDDGKNIEEALVAMLGSDEGDSSLYNEKSSTIKGILEHWYYDEILANGYNEYVEDTVWCNDRSIYQLGGFNPNGGLTNLDVETEVEHFENVLMFSEIGNAFDYSFGKVTTYEPKLICGRNVDKFTAGSVVGNADLDYPVGLLTFSETVLAGGFNWKSNESYYLSGDDFWINTPYLLGEGYAFISYVYYDGLMEANLVNNYGYVRPSISLKPGFSLVGNGDGSVNNPYVVNDDKKVFAPLE